MEYINGVVATELRDARQCADGLFGSTEQDRKFRARMAQVQVEISSITFDKIGSLYHNEATSEFYVGPELESGAGPWTSAMDFYNDLAGYALKVCTSSTMVDLEMQKRPSFALPVLFSHLISLYRVESADSFRLVNRDFGAHNLLVNQDFDIVGVIDFDGMMAAPIEVAAQYQF